MSDVRTKWFVDGIRNGQVVCLNCDAYDKEDAKFVFSHSPDAFGVKIKWKSLHEQGHCNHGKRFEDRCKACDREIERKPEWDKKVRFA